MSQNIVRNSIVATLFNIFNQGRYTTVAELNALKGQLGVDGNTFGAEIEAMNKDGLFVQNADGTFGLTPSGVALAQSFAAAPAAGQVLAQPAPVAAAPAPVPQQAAQPTPAPAATTGKGGKKGGKKAQTEAGAAGGGGARPEFMKYKLMSALSLAELAQRIEVWTVAAEANYGAGQILVADGLARSVSRAKRRLRRMQAGLPATQADE